VVRVFLAIQRILKIVITRVKKLQKLINEVQKKTKQNRKQDKTETNRKCKNQKVYFMPKSIECAHRKYEKVDTHKK